MDWGDARDGVDVAIKGILDANGYTYRDIRIQPRYNIGRFHVKYTNRAGIKDTFKIEIGYTRRIPVLETDDLQVFRHPTRGVEVYILSPVTEELFANKYVTLLARKGGMSYLRDLFDVAMMSRRSIDRSLLVDAAMIEALLGKVDLEAADVRPADLSQLSNLTSLVLGDIDIDTLLVDAMAFHSMVREGAMTLGWPEFREDFWAYGVVRLDLLKNPGRINRLIEGHPLLQWLRRRR